MLRFELVKSPAKKEAERCLKVARTGTVPKIFDYEVLEYLLELLGPEEAEFFRIAPKEHFANDKGEVVLTKESMKKCVDHDIEMRPLED